MLTREQILDNFKGKLHCSQIVLAEMADDLGYDREELLKMGAAFGGGMFCGDTCGTVTGAMVAIGLKYGNAELGNAEQEAICKEKVKAFQTAFIDKFGTTFCRELLGYDFSDPKQIIAARESGKSSQVCPGFVLGSLDILRNLDVYNKQ